MNQRTAFTLVELLVAGGVFAVLVLILLQAIGNIDSVTSSQRRYLEAVGSARLVFDRLGQDLRTLVTEGEARVMVEMRSEAQSDRLSFLSLSRPSSEAIASGGGTGDVRFTRITYELQEYTMPGESKAQPVLMRRQIPVYWDEADYHFTTVLNRNPAGAGVASPLAPGVFRFEVTWIRSDGTLTRDPRGTAEELPPGSEEEVALPSGFVAVDPQQVKGFILSLAVLDHQHLERMDSFAELYASFPGVAMTASNIVPVHQWRAALASAKPEYAVKNIRILQRTYYLWQ